MKYIKTNFGLVPLEDYLDIKSAECGFESYDDLIDAGYNIEISEVDIVEV